MPATVTPEAALAAAISAMAGPFGYPDRDCVRTACAAFAALWGVDPLAGCHDLYAGPRQAARLIREAGGMPALVARQAARVGLVPGAGPGSLALSPRGILMLGLGAQRWAAKGPVGATFLQCETMGWTWAPNSPLPGR